MSFENDVYEFRQAFNREIHSEPTLLDKESFDMHVGLIQEEFDELKEAYANNDLVEVFDAVIDLLYVVTGLGVHSGFPVEEGWNEVHESNLSKLDENGNPIISDGTDGYPKGKILKGPNTFKPNLKAILEYAK